jgi:hypothetical protein
MKSAPVRVSRWTGVGSSKDRPKAVTDATGVFCPVAVLHAKKRRPSWVIVDPQQVGLNCWPVDAAYKEGESKKANIIGVETGGPLRFISRILTGDMRTILVRASGTICATRHPGGDPARWRIRLAPGNRRKPADRGTAAAPRRNQPVSETWLAQLHHRP